MRLSVYAVAVARAAEIAGGIDVLAAELGYSRALLGACITGSHETPTVIFLKVVDYLMAHDPIFAGNLPSTEKPAPPSGGEQSPR
jgi:hypothetical protein